MTITEKILAHSAGQSAVEPGDYIWVTSPCPVTLYPGLVRGPGQMLDIGYNKVFNPELVTVVDGHAGDTASHNASEDRRAIHEWAASVGVPRENLIDLGRQGVEMIIAAERAWALPGECYFQVVNGHTSTLGGLGAFSISTSYGSGGYLIMGKTWIKVPPTAKFVVKGRRPKGVGARDIFEYVLGQVGPGGAAGMVMEWSGPAIDELSIDERCGLCASALFTGAWTAIVNPDEKTINFVRQRTKRDFEPLVSDPDAHYAREYEFDISDLEPQIVPPPKRFDIKPVKELEGTPINRGYIGSESNGWSDDMRITARILEGRVIHPDVILNITPGSVTILLQCLDEGWLRTFIQAECLVPTPCAGMEYGANTPLASGDVCVATGATNYPGRMGSTEADIYLASPATVAASCLEGKITDPRKYL